MSQTLRGTTLKTGAEAADELDATTSLALPVGDIFERLWHLLISMRTGLVLMLFLALLTLVGTLLTQVPAGMQADPTTYGQWLDSLKPKYGGWTAVFDAIGVFNVFNSVAFKATVVLLTTSILACSVNRAPRLWKQAVHPRLVASPAFLDHAPLSAGLVVEASRAMAVAAVAGELKRRHFRTIVTEDADGIAIYADRFRWGPFGTVIAHLSLILILIGAVLGTGGFRLTDFAVAVDSTISVGNGTSLAVKALSFNDQYYDNGQPADYASDLVVYDNGVQIAQKTIRVNDPLRVGDITFYQSFFGPAADMVVTDAKGTSLFAQGVPMMWGSSDGTKSIGQFAVPNTDLTVYVIGAASGRVDPTIKAGQVQLEVYQGTNTSTPVAVQVVDEGKTVTIAGVSMTFVREREFTGLIVARDPGAPFVWLGAIALVLGVVLVFLFPSRRLWARIHGTKAGTQIQVAAATRHDVGFEATFRSLVDAIQEKGR